MSFGNVSDVDPAVHAGNNLFIVLAVLEDRLEPFKDRSTETLRLFDRINYGLNGADSLEHVQPRMVHRVHTPKIYTSILAGGKVRSQTDGLRRAG